ncbi:MAG: HPF/RaiA family ribosome-associated protein, partial [Myxococcales bacterium]|nr:HPF/RaiA family ribosome-associated protein [Myxococcales bacterium]
DELRAYTEAHLLDPIRNHTGLTINRVEVQLFSEGQNGGCHVLVEMKGHKDINVREMQDNIQAAVDVAKDRVIRNLTDVRDKILTQRRHPKKLSLGRLRRALGWLSDNRSRQT